MTFVDGLGVGDVHDVALRDRRHLSEDGVLIVVATLAGTNGDASRRAELIARGFADPTGRSTTSCAGGGARSSTSCLADDIREIKLLQEHVHDGIGQLVYDRTGRRPMILPVRGRGLSVVRIGTRPELGRAPDRRARAPTRTTAAAPDRRSSRACEVAALAFCRLLERWASGDAAPSTPGQRQAALRRAADRVETALAGLERPLGQYLLELEAERAEGRSWYGEPGAGELRRLGARAEPRRSARVAPSASPSRTSSWPSWCARSRGSPPRRACGRRRIARSLWAGLFDLRENLLGRTLDDLRALAA